MKNKGFAGYKLLENLNHGVFLTGYAVNSFLATQRLLYIFIQIKTTIWFSCTFVWAPGLFMQ